jgi:transposase
MSYSVDFRHSVLNNIKNGMLWSEAVKTFKISSGTIDRWIKLEQKTGLLSDLSRKPYKPRKIDTKKLLLEIEKTPDATLEELASHFNCWPQSIHKRCKKLGITRKKNNAVFREKREKKTRV